MSPQPRLCLGCGDIWESVVSQPWPQTRYQFLQYSSIGSDNGLVPADDKPLSEPMMVSLLTHICVTRPQWVNGLEFLLHIYPRCSGLLHWYWGHCVIPWLIWVKSFISIYCYQRTSWSNRTIKNKVQIVITLTMEWQQHVRKMNRSR